MIKPREVARKLLSRGLESTLPLFSFFLFRERRFYLKREFFLTIPDGGPNLLFW